MPTELTKKSPSKLPEKAICMEGLCCRACKATIHCPGRHLECQRTSLRRCCPQSLLGKYLLGWWIRKPHSGMLGEGAHREKPSAAGHHVCCWLPHLQLATMSCWCSAARACQEEHTGTRKRSSFFPASLQCPPLTKLKLTLCQLAKEKCKQGPAPFPQSMQ